MAGFLRGCGLSTRPGSGQSSRRSTQENTKGRDCNRRAATRPLRGGARGTQIDAALATIGRLALVDLEASGEIGRASCRARVCKYVSISVVAVSLKKQQSKINT